MDPRVTRSVLFKALEAFVAIIASFVQLAIIVRAYPPETVGTYQLTVAWLFIGSATACFAAISMITSRELSQRDSNSHVAIFSSAVILQLQLVAFSGAVLLMLFAFTEYFEEIRAPLIVGTMVLFAAMTLQLSQSILVSRERVPEMVIASIISHVFASLAMWAAAWRGVSVTLLVFGWATYYVVSALLLVLFSKAWQRFEPASVTHGTVGSIAIEVVPVSVMVVATHLYVRIDVTMLDYFLGKEEVAKYSAGYLFLDQLMILSNFMMSALYPNFARATLDKGTEFRVLYRGILRLFLLFLVPVAALIALFSHPLLECLYGKGYASAAPSLALLMLGAVLAWLNGPSGTIFISLRKQHLYMWATIISLLVNVAGNFALIPLLGAIGAAVATVLTELAICVFCLYFIYRATGYLPWMKIEADQA